MMFGVGLKLGRTVVAQTFRPQAVPSPHHQSDYLRCSEWMRTHWKWDVTASTVADSELLVTCRTCPFPDLAQPDSHVCQMEMGILGGISDRLFNYGKVSLRRSHSHPPRECRFTVYTERTPQSIAAEGWSCPPSHHEDTRRFDAEAAAQMRALLTPREQQILALLAEGFSDKQIAATLNLSVRTVEGHLGKVREKTALSSRSALIRFALRIAVK
jgi:DNA-binding CsgD family transcriptional regulator